MMRLYKSFKSEVAKRPPSNCTMGRISGGITGITSMGLILDLSPRVLEKVLYFASYIVLDAGESNLEYKQILSEKEYQDARETYGNKFRVGMGAEAIKELLQQHPYI